MTKKDPRKNIVAERVSKSKKAGSTELVKKSKGAKNEKVDKVDKVENVEKFKKAFAVKEEKPPIKKDEPVDYGKYII